MFFNIHNLLLMMNNSADKVKKVKDNLLIDYYNNFYKELSRLDEQGNSFDKIKDMLPILEGNEKIIDIGCGHGGVCEKLIKDGYEVYGIEINDDAIVSLKRKGFKILKYDLNHEIIIKEEFDIVLLLDILEHMFNPLFLFDQAKKLTRNRGYIIVSVPLYFDLIDRFKILFTGSVISMDNLCYGKEHYKKFRSYNYDHIRFFRPYEMIELGSSLDLKIDKIEYQRPAYYGNSKILKKLYNILFNSYFVNKFPNLFAHSMKIRWRK
jgi:2-polyprenyl-3-methyl-5-hydroxy-6-metoxy-1,4-benzoquinol methylase